jgi:hypothetical protein
VLVGWHLWNLGVAAIVMVQPTDRGESLAMFLDPPFPHLPRLKRVELGSDLGDRPAHPSRVVG